MKRKKMKRKKNKIEAMMDEWCRCAGGVIESSRSSITFGLFQICEQENEEIENKKMLQLRWWQPKKICFSFFFSLAKVLLRVVAANQPTIFFLLLLRINILLRCLLLLLLLLGRLSIYTVKNDVTDTMAPFYYFY